MRVGVRGRVAQSDTARVVRALKRNAAALPRRSVARFNAAAAAASPVLSGRMKSEHKTKDTGTYSAMQTVDVEYGVYVNFGTRYQHAQPWWSTAWKAEERILKQEIKELFK